MTWFKRLEKPIVLYDFTNINRFRLKRKILKEENINSLIQKEIGLKEKNQNSHLNINT